MISGVRSRQSRRVRSRWSRRRAILECDLDEVEGVRSRRSQRCVILASGFAGEVEGCDLGAIRSQSRTAKSNGNLGSRRDLGSWRSGCDSKSNGDPGLYLSLRVSPKRESKNGLKWKFSLQTISAPEALFYGQIENIFSLTQFSGPTKHAIFRKRISEFRLKSKQTEP